MLTKEERDAIRKRARHAVGHHHSLISSLAADVLQLLTELEKAEKERDYYRCERLERKTHEQVNMLTKEERDAIRERVEKATPGPWEWGVRKVEPLDDGRYTCGELVNRERGDRVLCIEPNEYGIDEVTCWNPADREVVSHAREDIPRLLDALEEAESREAKLVEALRKLRDAADESADQAWKRWELEVDMCAMGAAAAYDHVESLITNTLKELGYGER